MLMVEQKYAKIPNHIAFSPSYAKVRKIYSATKREFCLYNKSGRVTALPNHVPNDQQSIQTYYKSKLKVVFKTLKK